jgi:hypothetical protein
VPKNYRCYGRADNVSHVLGSEFLVVGNVMSDFSLTMLDRLVLQLETEEALEDRYVVLVIDPQLKRYYAHGPLPAIAAMKVQTDLRASCDASEDCADLEVLLVPCTEP